MLEGNPSDDADELKRFLRTNSHRVAVDVVDAPVFLAAHASELDVAKERWEGIRFHAMREHAGLVFQDGVFE